MNQFLVILLILAVGAVAVYFFLRAKKQRKYEQAQGGCPDTHAGTSSQGICLPRDFGLQEFHQIDRRDGGFVMTELPLPDDDVFQAMIGDTVIAGLQQAIDSALHHNPTWSKFTSTREYMVIMIRKHTLNQDGTPALITSGIQTAGTVVNVWQDGTSRGGEPTLVLPQPDSIESFRDAHYMAYLQASARHEAEHAIEYKNHLGTFLKKIGAGDVHPHWTLPNEMALGFVSPKAANCLGAPETPQAVAIENGKTVKV